MTSRPWFDDGPQKTSLLQRIADGLYIQFSLQVDTPRKDVGQVLRTIYAGYKVKNPSGDEGIVNPSTMHIVEFANVEEYNVAAEQWSKEEAIIQEAAHQKRQAIEAARQAVIAKQLACLHENITREAVICAAGCDIYDLVCDDCGKQLERSWSTAYDNDPKSHISDWNWFLRYCHKEYKGYVPKREDYVVVDITDQIVRYILM